MNMILHNKEKDYIADTVAILQSIGELAQDLVFFAGCRLEIHWMKSHSGVPGNERADFLAGTARESTPNAETLMASQAFKKPVKSTPTKDTLMALAVLGKLAKPTPNEETLAASEISEELAKSTPTKDTLKALRFLEELAKSNSNAETCFLRNSPDEIPKFMESKELNL